MDCLPGVPINSAPPPQQCFVIIYEHAHFDVRNLLLSLYWIGTKTANKDVFPANLVHLCKNVCVIARSKFYFQKPAVVEILTKKLRGGGHFLLVQCKRRQLFEVRVWLQTTVSVVVDLSSLSSVVSYPLQHSSLLTLCKNLLHCNSCRRQLQYPVQQLCKKKFLYKSCLK